jgi:hypothetical protein
VTVAWLSVLATVALQAACGPAATPEDQVRAVVAAGEEAAEARDLSGLLDLVSPAYLDDEGRGRDELAQYLRGYLVTHPSVHLLTRVRSVEFPYRDLARVELTVGSLGQEESAGIDFDLAADIHDVRLELALEDGDWRVTRARWQRAGGGG